jgi:hypothetical protein
MDTFEVSQSEHNLLEMGHSNGSPSVCESLNPDPYGVRMRGRQIATPPSRCRCERFRLHGF